MAEILGFKEFFEPKKLLVEIPERLLADAQQRLDEATRATVGKHTARRDPPHFPRDEYHAHVAIPGGYEVAWGKSGARRHENKFPAKIPNDARAAVAKVLGVSPDLLEVSIVQDHRIGERVVLVEMGGGQSP